MTNKTIINQPTPREHDIFHDLCKILINHQDSVEGLPFYDEVLDAYEMNRTSLHENFTVYEGGRRA